MPRSQQRFDVTKGTMVTKLVPAELRMYHMRELLLGTELLTSMERFPGPLKNPSKKELLKTVEELILNRYNDPSSDIVALRNILKLLVEFDGVSSSRFVRTF